MYVKQVDFTPASLLFLSFLCPQYVRVLTLMINHIVLYTLCKLAIITDGGGVGDVRRQNGRIDKSKEGTESVISFLSLQPFFSIEMMNEQLLHSLIFSCSTICYFFIRPETRKKCRIFFIQFRE
jgi:hypothetical protein